MIFLQAVPHDLYFQWQIEVQIVNFRKFELSQNMHICVWYPKGSDQIYQWEKIKKKYPEVKIFLYEDRGVNLQLYIPQLRPHVLKRHFEKYPELSKEVIFYHDSDIIFNYLPNFDFLKKGNICWQSDCSGYLDYSYLLSKEEQGNIKDNIAIKKLAEIGNISPNIIKNYNKNTGGAQTIVTNIDSNFWNNVEQQCLNIRKSFLHGIPDSINSLYFNSESEGFQSWCADMWALNFEQCRRNQKTCVTKDLDFSWATDSIETFNKKPIFHNAGALKNNSQGVFYKGDWINKSPIGLDIKIPPKNTASYMYVLAIKEVTD